MGSGDKPPEPAVQSSALLHFSSHDSSLNFYIYTYITTIGWRSASGFQNREKLCHHPRAEIS